MEKGSVPLGIRIIKAGLVVACAHVLLKFAGLIQAVVATRFLNTQEYEIIITVAFSGIIYSLFLVGEEIIGPTLMPVFKSQLDLQQEKEAWHTANVLLSFQFLILLVIVIWIIINPDFFIRIFTHWTPDSHPQHYQMLKSSLQILAPGLLFLSLGSTTYILLNAYRRFFLAAFGDTAWKFTVIIGIVLGIGILKWDYRILAWSLLIGCLGKLGIHLCGLVREIRMVRFSLDWKDSGFRTILLLMVPLIGGIIFAKYRDLFNNTTVLTYLPSHGLIQANDLGRKLFTAIQWLIPYSLQIALFPFLCELIDQNDLHKLGEIINRSVRLILALFVPMTFLLMLIGERIAVVLFYTPKTPLFIALCSGISTICYSFVLPAAAVECVFMQAFFAKRRVWLVTILGILCSFLSVLISYVGIVHHRPTALMALLIVSGGFVFSRYLKTLILFLCLRQDIPVMQGKEHVIFFQKLLLLSLLLCGMGWITLKGIHHLFDDGLSPYLKWEQLAKMNPLPDDTLNTLPSLRDGPSLPPSVPLIRKSYSLLILLTYSIVTTGFYFLFSWILHFEEPFLFVSWSWDWFKRKKEKKGPPVPPSSTGTE